MIPSYVPDENVLHVVPQNDLKDHVCNRMKCWCLPVLVDDEKCYIVVHNSMDGRENYETGERLPS